MKNGCRNSALIKNKRNKGTSYFLVVRNRSIIGNVNVASEEENGIVIAVLVVVEVVEALEV